MDIPPRQKLPALPLPDAPEGGQAMRFTCSVQKAEQVTAALLAEKPAAVYVPVEELERLDPELDWGETELCCRAAPHFPDSRRDAPAAAAGAAPRGVGGGHRQSGPSPHRPGTEPNAAGRLRTEHFQLPAPCCSGQGQELASATVSFELRWQQVRDLRKYLPCEAIIYGGCR